MGIIKDKLCRDLAQRGKRLKTVAATPTAVLPQAGGAVHLRAHGHGLHGSYGGGLV